MDSVRLTSFEMFTFILPLKYPLHIKGKKLAQRHGLLLFLRDDENHTGLGEIAPLPGLHPETLNDCIREIRETVNGWIGRTLAIEKEDWRIVLKNLTKTVVFNSVRFGLESALLDVLVKRRQQNTARILSSKYDKSVPLNGLLFGSAEEIIPQARELADAGYRSLKIKVGRINYAMEQKTLLRMLDELPEVTLRLDANRAWPLDTALHFVENLPPERIEYIEEPVRNKEDLAAFCAESPIPVALDETLSDRYYEDYFTLPHLATAIIKPTVLGGILSVEKMAVQAAQAGLNTVISDTFSSGVGLAVHLALAAAWGKHTAAGLDTYRYLNKDVLTEPLILAGGQMDVDGNLDKAQKINPAFMVKTV